MKKIKTLTLFVTVVLFLAACSKDAVEDGYQDKYTYTSPLEKKYAANGSYAVTHETHDAVEPRIKKYSVWYPSAMTTSDTVWPLVVIANGTGTPASRYKPIFEHMASWGFVVVGCEDEWMADGLSTSIMLDFMLSENENAHSPLYHRIDTSRVGLCGHSQGGMATFSASTQFANRTHYKAICVQSSAVSQILTDTYGWSVITNIAAPTLLMAGTGNSDANMLCKYEDMLTTYDSISGQPAMMGRLVGMEHGDVLKRGEAYTMAWMLYWLCNDQEAARCFVGDDAEMLHNSQWQDVEHKNL